MKPISLTNAITGFLIEKEAAAYSKYTLRNYRLVFRRLCTYLDADRDIADISASDITQFMAHLTHRDEAPNGIAARPRKPLSKKTLRNHHTALSSLWTWAVAHNYCDRHVVHDVPPPRPSTPSVHPFSGGDIRAMLSACKQTTDYRHVHSDEMTSNARPTALRDRAILLLLFDTGLRNSELCNLTWNNLNLRDRTAKILGKGSKERIIPFSAKTGRAIWEYQTQERPSGGERVFLNTEGRPLKRNALLKLVKRIAKRAGVRNAYPHRFRHTFAIEYLRNRGDVYTLKQILGHSTLEMVNRYLEIANSDIQEAHHSASPVANLL